MGNKLLTLGRGQIGQTESANDPIKPRVQLVDPGVEVSCLLFHPGLTHWETKTGYAALLGQVRDRSGEVIGLHRTYIVNDGNEVRNVPGGLSVFRVADDGKLQFVRKYDADVSNEHMFWIGVVRL